MSSLHHFPDIREKLEASSSIKIVLFENNEYYRRLNHRSSANPRTVFLNDWEIGMAL